MENNKSDDFENRLLKRDSEIDTSSYSYKPRKDGVKQSEINRRKAYNRVKFVLVCVVLCIIIILGAVMYDNMCVVSEIVVTDCNVYSSKEVIKHSGIKTTDRIFDFSEKDVGNRLCKALPYIKNINIKRHLPDKIEIQVVQEKPSAYVSIGNVYYIISDSLKVLKMETDKQKVEDMKLIHVYVSKVSECIIGDQLRFEDPDFSDIFVEIIGNFKKNGIVGLCDELDIRNKFEVSFFYKNSYHVKLGEGLNSGLKIEYMLKIANQLSEHDFGIIDVSDIENNEGSFVKK